MCDVGCSCIQREFMGPVDQPSSCERWGASHLGTSTAVRTTWSLKVTLSMWLWQDGTTPLKPDISNQRTQWKTCVPPPCAASNQGEASR
jgi:hypothetical protein